MDEKVSVDQDLDSDLESTGLLSTRQYEKTLHPRSSRTGLLLRVSIFLNVLLVLLGTLGLWVFGRRPNPSYTTGFPTDLSSARDHIEIVQYAFTGGVEIDEHGEYVADASNRSQQYIGTPRPELENAWAGLMAGINMKLPSVTNTELKDRTFQWTESGEYLTGLEVFHSLHCLNRLRQALYPEIYPVFDNPDDPARDMHIGHCINHLRQSIQCHADLTPMEWVQVGSKVILNTNTVHTCRNFDKIQAWASQHVVDLNSEDGLFFVD